MRQLRNRFILAGVTAGLCFALVAEPAFAVVGHKSIDAEPGKTVRVGNHIHFRFSTCETISTPKIVIRQQPAKGRVTVIEEVVPLRNAQSEGGKRCLGKPMRAATVHYTPFANTQGGDTFAYDAVYPRACTNCGREVSVAITMGGQPVAEPVRAAPSLGTPAEKSGTGEPAFSEAGSEGTESSSN